MRVQTRFFIGCWLLLFAFGVSALAQIRNPIQNQQKKNDDETLRIETELVQIEVTVTDKQGKLVRDLTRADFELKEDGKLQDIAYFSIGTSGNPAKWLMPNPKKNNTPAPINSVADTPTETRAGRYIVLALDDLHLAFSSLNYVKQAMTKFIDQQMTGADQVALITTSGQLGMYQQFTNDRVILKRAIERLSLQQRGNILSPFEVPRISAYQAELIDSNLDPDALNLAVNEVLRQFPGTTRDAAISQVQSRARQIVAESVNYTKASLGTIENTLRGLRLLPGRKSIILVSDGFLLGGTNQGTFDQLRRITDAATRSGAIIYALDARGLVASPQFDASMPGTGLDNPPGVRSRLDNASVEAARDGLNALSRDTGGFPVFNNNDLSLGLQQIIDDTETYYLLAFEPLISYRDGRYRKLEVRVRNHPDYKVRSSKGYFAPDDKALAKAAEKVEKERIKFEQERQKNPEKAAKKEVEIKQAQVREAFSSLFPLKDIPVEMAVDFVDSGQGQSYAVILAHIDLATLGFEYVGDRFNADFEVVGTLYDEKGIVVDHFAQTAHLRLKPENVEKYKTGGVIFQRRTDVKPGYYQVRLAVRNEARPQLGSASAWVQIPDLNRKQISLSSIFLASQTDPKTTPNLAPNAQTTKPVDPQTTLRMPVHISRRINRGENLEFTIFAYHPKRDGNGNADVVVQTQVFAGTKLMLATPASKMNFPEDNPKATFMAYAARVLAAEFTPGTYELRVVVVDRNAKTSARQSTYFTIAP